MKYILTLLISTFLFACTTLSPVVTITDPETLHGEVTAKDVVVLTVWSVSRQCGECRAFDSKLPDLQAKYGESLKVVLVDADKWPMGAFGIPGEAVPFYAISINGKVYAMGNADLSDLEPTLDKVLTFLPAKPETTTPDRKFSRN